MPEFLKLMPPDAALQTFFDHIPPSRPETEMIETIRGLGRVLAGPVTAPETLPAFSRSTVDGFAVRAADTFGASDSLPIYLTVVGEVPMGGKPGFQVEPNQTAVIHTGGMLPEGADAVVMMENTQTARVDEVEILRAAAVGENIIKAGEDVVLGQEVLPGGTRLRPAQIGGLLALGILKVRVNKPPRFGILSSGDEVVPPEQKPDIGQVRDTNSYSLSALIEQHGGLAIRYGISPDDPQALRKMVERALAENDAVVVTAGSSASTRDLTSEIIHSLGKPGVLVHGVNVRPGKPTILGVCDGKPVIGLPGNPVSALVIAGLFVKPVVRHLAGMPADEPRAFVPARLSLNISTPDGRESWVPVRLTCGEKGYLAEPIFYKSNLIFTLASADGLICIPAAANGLAAGEDVQVYLI